MLPKHSRTHSQTSNPNLSLLEASIPNNKPRADKEVSTKFDESTFLINQCEEGIGSVLRRSHFTLETRPETRQSIKWQQLKTNIRE